MDLLPSHQVPFAGWHCLGLGTWVRAKATPQLRVLVIGLRATCTATSQFRVTCSDAKITILPISGQWPLAGQGASSLQAGGGRNGAAGAPLQVMGWWPLVHPASSGPYVPLTPGANTA